MKNKKKGFTIVELVIVIGVIGILSAILIPTFINLSSKAQLASDQSDARNMTTYLRTAKISGKYNSISEVYEAFQDSNYDIKSKTPSTSDAVYGFDMDKQEIGLYNKNTHKLMWSISGEEGTDITESTYLFYPNNTNAMLFSNSSLSDEEISSLSFNAPVSICVDKGKVLKTSSISINSESQGHIEINGMLNVDSFTINCPNASAKQDGVVCGTLDVNAINDQALTINGYIQNLAIGNGSYNVSKEGAVLEITEANTNSKLTIDGYVGYISDSEFNKIDSTSENPAFINNGFLGKQYDTAHSSSVALINEQWKEKINYNVEINNVEDLLKFSAKTQHSLSPYISHDLSIGRGENLDLNYRLVNVSLNKDIDLENIVYVPIASWDSTCTFKSNTNNIKSAMTSCGGRISNIHMHFNGNNHIIKNMKVYLAGEVGLGSTIENIKLNYNYDNTLLVDENKNVVYVTEYDKVNVTQINRGTTDPCHYGCVTTTVGAYSPTSSWEETDRIIFNNLVLSGYMYFDFENPGYDFKRGYIIENAYTGWVTGHTSYATSPYSVTNCDISELFVSNTFMGTSVNVIGRTSTTQYGYNCNMDLSGDTSW